MTAVPVPRRGPATLLLRSLLGGGIAYFVLFVAVHAVLAAGSGLWTPVDAALLLLVSGPQLLLVLRRRLDLGRRLTAVVIGALLAAAVLGFATLPPGVGGTSYDAWFLGAIAFNLLGLAIVGRYGAAWLTMLAIVLLAEVWAAATGQGVGGGLGLVVRHVGTLLVGTALAVGLRRSNAAFVASRAAERGRRAEEEAARASTAARRVAAERVLEQSGPMLRAIANGRRLTAEDRRQLLVLEGALRDEIRTPALVRGALRTSVDAARRRGMNVLLMDEAAGAPAAGRRLAAAWLAERLDEVPGGSFVGRLRDLEGELRVSAVTDDGGDARTFPRDG